MSIPIFNLPKIKHETVKHRKDFIIDCLFVGVGVSILYVALEENFAEGVKALHKNKHRKNIKKIREIYENMNKKKLAIYERLDTKDRNTLAHKNENIVSRGFIQTIAKSKEDLSLEYMAITILKAGLTRKRKTKIHPCFKDFSNFMTLTKIIRSVKEAISEDYTLEWEVAKNFVREVRY